VRIFTLTQGRTGTKYLATLFAENFPDLSVHHEILHFSAYGVDTPDISLMHEFNNRGNTKKVKEFWNNKFSQLPEDYVETSHILGKAGLVENAPKGTHFIILRRDKEKVLSSYAKRGDFNNIGNMWMWYLDPGYHKNLTELDPNIPEWYYDEMEARIDNYVDAYQEVHYFHEVFLEDLNDGQHVAQLFDDLGLKYDNIKIPSPQNMSNNPSVFLGIPNTGRIHIDLSKWMMYNINSFRHISMPQKKPHDHARNYIVNEFLQTSCEWLLMVDSDIIPPMNVLDMVNNNVDVCSAYITINHNGKIMPLAMEKVDGGYRGDMQAKYNELNKVDATGTGCLLINRRIFDRLDKPYFRFVYDDNGMLVNGEDFDFCDRVKKLGIDIYFDARYICKHATEAII